MFRRLSAMPEMIWKAIAAFGLRFSGLGLQFLGSIVIARHLGAESFGAYIFAFTCANLAGTCLTLGMAELSVREVPLFVEYRDGWSLRRYLKVLVATMAAMSGVVALGFFLLEQLDILVLEPGWVLVTSFALSHALVLAAEKNMAGLQYIVSSKLCDSLLRPGLYVGSVLAFLFLGFDLSTGQILGLAALAALTSAGVMWFWVVKILQGLDLEGSGRKGGPLTDRKWWYAASVPMMLTTVVNMLMLDVDVLMIGVLLGDFEVGIYRPAVRGVALINMANLAAVQTLGPLLARALARKDAAAAQALLAQAVMVTAGLGLLIGGCLIAGGSYYLGLFGPEFLAARPALLILVAGQLFAIVNGGGAALLIMLRREKIVFWLNVVTIVLNVGLNSLLIPIWGIEGAALSTAVSIGFIKVAFVVMIRRVSDYDPTIVYPLRRKLGRG